MATRFIEIIVGLFILAGFLALAFLAFQASGLRHEFRPESTYRLHAEFNNVAGLKRRSKVMVAGVQVGQVEAIGIDPTSLRARVDMRINRDIDFLSEDSMAAIQTAGILGEKYVALSPGGAETMLGDGDAIRETQSALVLEDLVGRVLARMINK